jgi:putative transposase
MPQSLHILSAHIIFSTKERHPWLPPTIRKRVWAYQSRILQNLECNSITIGGVTDHVHVQSHEEVSDSEGVGNSQEGFV